MLVQWFAVMRVKWLIWQPMPPVARRILRMHWILRLAAG
ncbi:hypothetical protein O977_11780 [Mycobacterium avium subsp. paratuberculosis 10-5975]|nr:hypothetical protein O977_11780 [Mycobacterium avium subsp. paratuberculosis 10-5975]